MAIGVGVISIGSSGVGSIGIGHIGIEQQEGGDDLIPTPYPPATGQFWLSSSVTNMGVSPGAAYRNIIIGGAIESSVWIANGLYNMMCFDPAGYQAYAYCSLTADPTVKANWSGLTDVIGQGLGGYAGTPQHSWVMVDGNNLYCYFADTSNQYMWVATASISAPTVWTTQGTQTSLLPSLHADNGNNAVVKYNNTYYMFLENVLSISGYNIYQIGVFSSSSPTGPFTTLVNPLTSLRFNTGGQPVPALGGPWVGFESGTGLFVMYMHCGAWGNAVLPSSIYRATIPPSQLGTDNWTPADNGYAMMVCAGAYEIDQVADPFIVQGPSGTQYMFYEGGNNRNGLFELSVVTLAPRLMQRSGPNWVPADAGADPNPPFISPYLVWSFSANAGQYPQGNGPYGLPANVGTWLLDTTAANGYLYNALSYNSSAAQNDYISFDMSLAPGYWALTVMCHTGPAQGIITISFNNGSGATPPGGIIYDVPVGPTELLDCYSASDVYNVPKTIAGIQVGGTSTQRRRLVMQVATKNAASSGYGLGWHSFTMYRTSDYCPVFPE